MEVRLKIDVGTKKAGDTVSPSGIVYAYPKVEKIDQQVTIEGIAVLKKDYDVVKE